MINMDSSNNQTEIHNSGLQNSFRNLKQTDYEDLIEGMITFGYIFGAIFGAFIISFFTEKKGRKDLMLKSTMIYTIGSFITAFSFRTYIIPISITIGRFITGISIGALSVVCPIYISELAPANYRGIYIYGYHLFIIIGFIISTGIGFFLFFKSNVNPPDINKLRPKIDEPINNFYWRTLFIIQGIIGLLYCLMIYKIAESPRWLWFKEENIKAKNIYAKLHGRETSDIKSIEKYEHIKEDAFHNRSVGYSKFSELWRPNIRRRTLMIYFLFFFQQWTGYVIYKNVENPYVEGDDSIIDKNIILPALMTYPFFVMVIISFSSLVDQYGRRILLIFGTIAICIINYSNVIFELFNTNINKFLLSGPLFVNLENCNNNNINNDIPFYYDKTSGTNFYKNTCHTGVYFCPNNMNRISWDNTTFTTRDYNEIMNNICQIKTNSTFSLNTYKQIYCIIFIIIFLSTWEPISTIYQSEIFPLRIRGKGAAIGILSKYINQGLITFIGPRLILSKGKLGFLPYAILTSIAIYFVIIYCTETKGISLEEIDIKISKNDLARNRIRNDPLNNICENKSKHINI